MPKLKRNTSQVSDDAIYAMYDGPMPPSGVYPGVISSCYMSVSGNGNNMINVSGLFQTKGVEGKSKYDGFRIRGRIVIVDKEANMAREKAFYRAICGKENVEIVFADMDKGDKPGTVTKIGGVNPVGKKVKFQIRITPDSDQYGPELDYVLPLGLETSSDDEDLEEVEVEEEDEDEVLVDEDEDEDEDEDDIPDFRNMAIKELRELARSKGIKATKKTDIIDELADYYADNAEPEEDEGGLWTSEEAGMKSLAELQDYAKEHGVKAKKFSGMKKNALIKFLTNEELLSNEPPF